MEKVKVVIKHFVVRDKDFVIVQNVDGWYLAIDREYIDENGCTTRKLNGLQMKASKVLSECLNSVRTSVEIDYLVGTGKSRAEAYAIVFNMMDKLPELEKLWEGIN